MARLADRKIVRQTTRYSRVLLWMLRDAFRAFRTRIVLILIGSIAGVFLQGSVLALILMYASYLESGRAITLAGLTIESRSELAFFAVGGLSFLMLMLSATIIYAAKKGVAALSVAYEELCSRRIFELQAARPQVEDLRFNTGPVVAALLREQNISARSCGRALGTLINAIHPLIIVVYMTALLAYIDAQVTAAMFVLLALFLWGHYHVNVFVVENEGMMQKLQPKALQDMRRLFRKFRNFNVGGRNFSRKLDAAYGRGNIRGSLDCQRNRRMSLVRADLLSNVMIAVAMSVVVVYLGHQAVTGGLSWGRLIVYLISLRISVTGMRSVLNTIVAYARWYPHVRSYHALVDSAAASRRFIQGAFELTIPNCSGFGDLDACVLRQGDVAALVSCVDVNRYTLFHVIDDLFCAEGGARKELRACTDFLPERRSWPRGISLRQYLDVPDLSGWDDLRQRCGQHEFISWLEQCAHGDLDWVLSRDMRVGGMAAERAQLILLSAVLHPSNVVIVPFRLLARLSEESRAGWMRDLSRSVVIVNYRLKLNRAGSFGERVVICGNATGQCGLGTLEWAMGRRNRLNRLIRKGLARMTVDGAEDQEGLQAS